MNERRINHDLKHHFSSFRKPVWILILWALGLFSALALVFCVRHWTACLAGGLLGTGALIGILAWLLFRVVYDTEGFTLQTIFSPPRRHLFCDLWGIEKKQQLYLERGKLRLYRTKAYASFLEAAQKGYQRTHNGKQIPQVHSFRIPHRWDPFNGNVQEPMMYVFLYALLYVLYLAALAFVLISMRKHPEGSFLVAFWVIAGCLLLHTLFVISHIFILRNADVLPRWVVETLGSHPKRGDLTFHTEYLEKDYRSLTTTSRDESTDGNED